MSFQPFGYRFEIDSKMSAETAKIALRSKMKKWFDLKDGPRGWIFGSIMCIWLSAVDWHGPMVIARIYPKSSGIRIIGRAGSDLNNSIILVIMTALISVTTTIAAFRDGLDTVLPFSGFFVILISLVVGLLWSNSSSKRDADGLVRFINGTIGSSDKMGLGVDRSSTLPKSASILLNGDEILNLQSVDDLLQLIDQLRVGDFFIIEKDDENYMQLLSCDEHFVLERRDGGSDRHFQILVTKGSVEDLAAYQQNRCQLVSIIHDYQLGKEADVSLMWKPVSL